jgi:uncharacterized protein YndB with AHSA1/START domain
LQHDSVFRVDDIKGGQRAGEAGLHSHHAHVRAPRADVYRTLLDAQAISAWMVPDGRFVELVPNERVVEVVEFEAADPALRDELTLTFGYCV